MYSSVMDKDVEKVLATSEEITEIALRLAAEINRDYANMEGKLLLLGILKGSVVVMGELMKYINLPSEIDFMRVSSYYNSTKSSGNLNIRLDIDRKDLAECNILIIEDIIDSGRTLAYLSNYLKGRGAKSVRICAMFDKQCREAEFKDFNADYVGMVIPNSFVVGYGLDYNEKYRNLPYLGVLKKEVYEHK